MRRRTLAAAALALVAQACGGGGGVPSQSPSSPQASITPPPSASGSPAGPDLGAVTIRLVQMATLEEPLGMAVRRGDDALYIAEKTGRVVAISEAGVTPVLDLSGEVSGGYEQGLLGLAFSPDGSFLYVNFTDSNGDTHVTEFAFRDGRADTSSRREVLFVDQPYANHNGGNLVFGPDDYLYIGLGDGGSEGDPEDRGQDLGTLLAKLLRIDPRPHGDQPYAVPNDNPFVGRPGARPEIWAHGLRNPWRFSFDRDTGDLWIGDVGGTQEEEVDYQPGGSPGGQNYGWSLVEGTDELKGAAPPGAVSPIFEYTHAGGACVVTGGYVYRGRQIPELVGAYLFADFCVGRITALLQRDGRIVARRAFSARVPQLASFGEDQDGELYALSLDGPVYRLSG